MNYFDALNRPETLEKVLQILKREFKVLPTKGTMAGGAVACAVFEALEIDEINIKRYKDLDVFINTREDYADTTFKPLRRRRNGLNGTYSVSYDSTISANMTNRNLITILSSTMNEHRHNLVELDGAMRNQSEDEFTMNVLRSFDLTHCSVGINTKTNKIHFTSGFVDFLYQKKVNVQLLETANHTTVRYLEACENYKQPHCPTILSSLVQAMAIIDKVTHKFALNTGKHKMNYEPYLHGYLFSGYYQKRWNRFKHILSKAGAKSKPVVITRLDQSRHYHRRRCAKTACCFYKVSVSAPLNDNAKGAVKLLLAKKTTFHFIYSCVLNQFNNIELKNFDADDNDEMTRAWFEFDMKINLPELKLNRMHEKTVNKLIKLFADHDTKAMTVIMKAYAEIGREAQAVNSLRWIDKNAIVLFGLIDNMLRRERYEQIRKNIYLRHLLLNLDDLDAVRALAAKAVTYHMYSAHNRRIKPRHCETLEIMNTTNINKVESTEIATEFDLKELGKKQHHCVGGYFSVIEENQGSIFKVAGPEENELSTLYITHPRDGELKKRFDHDDLDEDDEYQFTPTGDNREHQYAIQEHRTFSNAAPSDMHRQYAVDLVNLLNGIHQQK